MRLGTFGAMLRVVLTLALALTVLAAGMDSASAEEPPVTASPSPTPGATTTPSPAPTTDPTPTEPPQPPEPPKPPDCRGAADTRTTSQRSKPFRVCGVPVFSKHHRVTAAYHPKLVTVSVPRNGISRVTLQPVAAKALKALFARAKKSGHKLVVRSAYRSYSTQKYLYRRDHVLTAPAGASEHQSGLAIDLAAIRKGRVLRGYYFGTSAAGRWVRKHAAEYGFIVRYPDHRKAITGIPYEPWHLRYVGTDVAAGVVKTKTQTLERYLKVTA